MSEDNYYAPPEAEVGEEPERKPGVVLMAMAILLTLLLGLIGFSRTASIGGIAMGVGGAIGSLLPAMLVVGLFQLGRRFRNTRSRWRIYAWSQFFFFLGQLNLAIQGL